MELDGICEAKNEKSHKKLGVGLCVLGGDQWCLLRYVTDLKTGQMRIDLITQIIGLIFLQKCNSNKKHLIELQNIYQVISSYKMSTYLNYFF